MKAKQSLMAAMAAASLALPIGTSPAFAQSGPMNEEAIKNIAPQVLSHAPGVSAMTASDNAYSYISEDKSIKIPEDPSREIVASTGSTNIGITLPYNERASDAQVVNNQPVYDNKNGSKTSPIVKQDGSLQITTIIETKKAPERYSYDLDLPQGATMTKAKDGSVIIKDPSGKFLAAFAPPWAKDSTKTNIPTHYQIRDDNLIQIVEHKSANVTYPIVADPWLGQELIAYWSVTFAGRGYTVNVLPTLAGRQFSAPYMLYAHTDELRTKMGGSANYLTPTIREQFSCHVAANFLVGEYNMESYRKYVRWYAQLNLNDQCNPGSDNYS